MTIRSLTQLDKNSLITFNICEVLYSRRHFDFKWSGCIKKKLMPFHFSLEIQMTAQGTFGIKVTMQSTSVDQIPQQLWLEDNVITPHDLLKWRDWFYSWLVQWWYHQQCFPLSCASGIFIELTSSNTQPLCCWWKQWSRHPSHAIALHWSHVFWTKNTIYRATEII